jgi:methanogenic corrinoid protein MtbC1
MADHAEILDALYADILRGDAKGSVVRVTEGLAVGVAPSVLLFEALIPSLEEVGRLFESGEYFLPEMLISARAMRTAMEALRPHLSATDAPSLGTVVMGTVAGDIHDIGKDMVAVMLEGAGFTIVDLGVNVPAAHFVEAIREHRPAIVGMSAFLTTTMPMIATTIEAIVVAGVRGSVRILVGGAPIDARFAEAAGADGYAPDASSAARLAKSLVAPGA